MRRPLWRRRQDDELNDELRSHLAMATQDRIDRGESPEHAASAALREFGNPLLVRETVRDTWGWTALEQWSHDLGYAVRGLRRTPAFSAAAVLTLALGIGANTAMFSIVRAVVLRPLPFADPDRLVALNELDLRATGDRRGRLSWPNFHDWRRRSRTIETMAGYHEASFTVSAGGPSVHVPGVVASPTLFTALGVAPAIGRAFVDADEASDADVAVVSDEFRRNHLGEATEPVGRGITVNGRPFTIVGVMPPGFVFPVETPAPQLWITSADDARVDAPDDTPMMMQRGAHFVQAIGRLRADASLTETRAELETIAAALATEYPDDNANRGATATPLLDALVGDVRRPLWLLMAAVGCVLLIACANVANLLTARGMARQAELALRVALGASRQRVVRLLVAEATVLAVTGAVCGVGIALWSIRALVPMAPSDVRGLDAVALDPLVFLFTGLVAGGCAVMVGVIPALRVTRNDPRQSLSASRTATGGPGQWRWLNGLVIAETSLGVVLVLAAALALDGLNRLSQRDPGFDVSGVVTMRVSLPDSRYPFAKQVTFFDQLLPELGAIPGVESSALVGPLPLGGARYRISLELPGDVGGMAAARPSPGFAFVSPHYFRTMRIAVRQGREFTVADTQASPRVAVINESFARRHFPGGNPIGQRIRPGLSIDEPETPWREVVGVVADATQVNLLDEPGPAFYVPYSQGMITTPHLVLRSAQAADAVPAAARRVIAAADPELAMYDVSSLQERLGASMASERFSTLLFTAFALLALLLSAVGLYGVLAYSVSQRAHEFGVRFALGADAGQVARVVLARALGLVSTGLLIGIASAVAAGRLMTSTLSFVQAPGAATYVAVTTVFLAIAVVCSVAPARRAARTDPLRVLRSG
jgi:putative ABC transport system permease protein